MTFDEFRIAYPAVWPCIEALQADSLPWTIKLWDSGAKSLQLDVERVAFVNLTTVGDVRVYVEPKEGPFVEFEFLFKYDGKVRLRSFVVDSRLDQGGNYLVRDLLDALRGKAAVYA